MLGIFPAGPGMDLHVVKGNEVLNHIAQTQASSGFTHTAIAFQTREQAVALEQLMAA